MSSQAPDPFEVTPLTPAQTAKILTELARWDEETRDELGDYRTEVLPTGRVLVLSDNEVPHVAYMSDDGPDARLCLDDFIPELAVPGLDPEYPSDAQPG